MKMEQKDKIRLNDGGKVLMTYGEVCGLLGYNPDSNFVEVTTAGTITFTAGKPHEVIRLARAVTSAGLVQANRLRQTLRSEFGFG